MSQASIKAEKPAINFIDQAPTSASLREDVLNGLCNGYKKLSPKHFYDKRGSDLFDAICDTAEYYPTRTEISILQNCVTDLAGHLDDDVMLMELGSGASRKIRILLDELQPSAYMAIDISREFLLQEVGKVAADYPQLEVHALCADLCAPLQMEDVAENYSRLAYFPGSSIGNFEPHEAVQFMANLHQVLHHDDRFLVGVDMKKDRQLLDAAYNDADGVTAEFNLNMLHRICHELDTDLEPDNFRHMAFYNDVRGRVEMHLVSDSDQTVRIEDQIIHFDADERIHTECSYKYYPGEFQALASEAGFEPLQLWTDEAQLFSLHLLQPR